MKHRVFYHSKPIGVIEIVAGQETSPFIDFNVYTREGAALIRLTREVIIHPNQIKEFVLVLSRAGWKTLKSSHPMEKEIERL